ncbi:transmembrane protein 267 [Lethenteron reissneri]|uniref:transmembrane protein 267 n=1 Tax=Lethenteron reissneri TaxID=7753 RepID=UPI002AB6C06D|nr:transmembrane protein 267 [Lethenteron reissneri]
MEPTLLPGSRAGAPLMKAAADVGRMEPTVLPGRRAGPPLMEAEATQRRRWWWRWLWQSCPLPPLSLLSSLLLALFCAVADPLCERLQAGGGGGELAMLMKAGIDSAVHGAVAMWSWAIVCGGGGGGGVGGGGGGGGVGGGTVAAQVLLAGFLACCLDLDHFVMAKSLRISDLHRLRGRPPLHNTTLVLALALSLELVLVRPLGLLGGPWERLPALAALAWLSHHVRDGARRGLWLWPLGSTPPLPRWAYLALTAALPHATALALAACGRSGEPGQRRQPNGAGSFV